MSKQSALQKLFDPPASKYDGRHRGEARSHSDSDYAPKHSEKQKRR